MKFKNETLVLEVQPTQSRNKSLSVNSNSVVSALPEQVVMNLEQYKLFEQRYFDLVCENERLIKENEELTFQFIVLKDMIGSLRFQVAELTKNIFSWFSLDLHDSNSDAETDMRKQMKEKFLELRIKNGR